MGEDALISKNVIEDARQEMLKIVWYKYGVNYYAVSNEKIFIDGGYNEFDDYVDIEVDGQAVYVIDKYGNVVQRQTGQNLQDYEIYASLPHRNERGYNEIPFEKLKEIADNRAAKISAYAHALRDGERQSGKLVHNYYYFMNIAMQELEDRYDDLHSIEPFYGEYMRVQTDNPDAIILKRIGDFYEVFGDKATQVAHILGLTLIRCKVGCDESVAMCGFPLNTADEYIAKLRERGDVVVND